MSEETREKLYRARESLIYAEQRLLATKDGVWDEMRERCWDEWHAAVAQYWREQDK